MTQKYTQRQSSDAALVGISMRLCKPRSNGELSCEDMHGGRWVAAGATVTVELCSPRRTS